MVYIQYDEMGVIWNPSDGRYTFDYGHLVSDYIGTTTERVPVAGSADASCRFKTSRLS